MSFSLYSQQGKIVDFISETGRSADGSVKACVQVNKDGYGRDLLIYRNGKRWDTLVIGQTESDYGDTCFIQTVQMDQKGLKEVVLKWSGRLSHSYGGELGGGFNYKFTKYEIWNLNTGKKLFAAQSVYYNQETAGFLSKTDSSVLRDRIVTCSYRYTLSVTKEGKIVISNLKEDYSVTYDNEKVNRIKEEKNACSFNKPDHKPGIYVLKGEQFVREGK